MATPISSISIIRFLFSALMVSLYLLCSAMKGCALGGGEGSQSQISHHLTLQISSLLPASVCASSTKDNKKRGSLKVLHRHGPCSHVRSLDKASAPTATQILSRDQSRVNSIQYRLSSDSVRKSLQGSQATLPAQSGLTYGSGNYIVTVGIGTPKKYLSLIVDTGSDLTWTQCQPCARFCYKQKEPIFDPSESSTYKNVSCGSAQCSLLASATGNSLNCSTTCIYGIQYGDSSFSVGYFGIETLALTPTDVFPNFLFGCGQNNQGLFGGAAGLLGLGRDKLSVVSQTVSKYGKYFSYCLPSISSPTGYLTFGKGGSFRSLKLTPLLTNPRGPSFYFIDIRAIQVGGRILNILPSVFRTAGTIIDSGTVITRLPPAAYSALRTAFRRLMTKYPLTNALSILDTCYDLSNYRKVTIPKISFFLAGKIKVPIEVPIDLSGILYVASQSQVCLAFAGNNRISDVGIFGNFQQQTLNVVYDVAGGKLGFAPGGCS